MFTRPRVNAVLLICLALSWAPPAFAQGEILITQAKALAGDVTPGDAPGFPVTLKQPGSYKLASNLTPGPNVNGILVNAPDVTIDLNGFRMSGGPAGGANNSGNGIVALGDRLTVKNGTLGAFKNAGILAPGRLHLIVENMRIVNGGRYGIYADNPVAVSRGKYTRIQNSSIVLNLSDGIVCGLSCHVEGSVVSQNGRTGITISTGTVLGNTISYNALVGIAAGNVGFGNNSLASNNSDGVQVAGPSLTELQANACFPAC